jgi:hypothetical protein
MIVNVASWLNLGRNNEKIEHLSIGGSLYRNIEPNRIEKEEFESNFTYNLIKIPIQVHIEKTYQNYHLIKKLVNIRDDRLPIKNKFLYTEVSYQTEPFKLIYTKKTIEHENPWISVFEISDLINQIEKNNDYLNRIKEISKNFLNK